VGNAGKSAQITLNHDYLLNHYALARRFEWVILLCGGNDVAEMLLSHKYEHHKSLVESTTLSNIHLDGHPLYQELVVVRKLSETFQRWMLRPTWKYIAMWIDDMRRQHQEGLKRRPIREVPREELQQAVAIYRENLNNLIATCRRQKQHLVMLTQPTIYRQDLPDELERLIWSPNNDGSAYTSGALAQVMDAFNQAAIDVCKQRGVHCLDLAAKLPKDATVFCDHVHFTDSGCENVADIVCDYVADKLNAQYLEEPKNP
jgi:hypothetical protein